MVGAPSDGGSTQLTDFVPFEIPVIATILGWYDGYHKEILESVAFWRPWSVSHNVVLMSFEEDSVGRVAANAEA